MPYRINNRSATLLALLFLGCGSALLYGAALSVYPLRSYAATPTQNLHMLVSTSMATRALIAFGVLLLFGQYALGLRLVIAAQWHPLTLRLIAGFALVFAVLLLLTHPATSSDLYDYLFRGRMVARYGLNTFTTPPALVRGDPLLRFTGWPQAVTAYGPLWEMLSWLSARLVGEARLAPSTPPAMLASTLLRLLLAYKLLDTLGFLLCGGAIWWALGQIAPGQRNIGLYVWLWNPLALWESVGAGHNDGWMLLPMILAIGIVGCIAHPKARRRIWRREQIAIPERPLVREAGALALAWPIFLSRRFSPTPALARSDAGHSQVAPAEAVHPAFMLSLSALGLLAVGALIKYIPLFVWPVLLAAACRMLPSWRQRWWLAFLSGLAGLVMVVLAYAPFWDGLGTLHNIGDRRAIFTVTWLNGLRWLLVWFGAADIQAQTTAALVGLACLAAGTAWAIWQAWQRPADIAGHVFWLLVWMILACNPTTQAWYLLWPLAIAALQPWRQRLVWALVFCTGAALLCYIVSSFAIQMLGL